jgi:hypothetical protein
MEGQERVQVELKKGGAMDKHELLKTAVTAHYTGGMLGVYEVRSHSCKLGS